MSTDELLVKVKKNLIIEHTEDDDLLMTCLTAAVSYAEGYQHLDAGWYGTHDLSPATLQGVIMLASHFYESRDGSTAGFFADNAAAGGQVMTTVNRLLILDREWKV